MVGAQDYALFRLCFCAGHKTLPPPSCHLMQKRECNVDAPLGLEQDLKLLFLCNPKDPLRISIKIRLGYFNFSEHKTVVYVLENAFVSIEASHVCDCSMSISLSLSQGIAWVTRWVCGDVVLPRCLLRRGFPVGSAGTWFSRGVCGDVVFRTQNRG